MLKKIFYSLLVLSVLGCLTGGAVLYWYVAVAPGEEISKENIRRILGRESPVFYNDGVTPLGVFFADAHRKYIEYQDIPDSFVDAIVAAEDDRFFDHFGFDIAGIIRAMIKNVQAGRVVQGGSTLTQQTAKNLFKRKNRSIKEKIKELLMALRLEYRYSKEEILEFYSNQFYVSGNGHGLGVAARYYFDKTPQELTLVESAFIAASVKRPNYYNPFIKKSTKEIELAKTRGRERVAYVLREMKKYEMIDEASFKEAMAAPIPFKNGTVGFALDYVMGVVTDAVSSERITAALAAQGIDNISTSGVKIITTVNRRIQAETLSALRRQLSELDVRLRGYEREEVQEELQKTDYQGDATVAVDAFLFGVIRAVEGEGDDIAIEVSLGGRNGVGVIDREGLTRMVDARTKYLNNRWTESKKKDVHALLGQLQEGDRVWVSVHELPDEGPPLLELERFPEVRGGAIVMREGRIAAVAGGVENRFFNRAVYGKRTMGSSYKPFVYTAALQLGWNSADLLSNRRDIFVYQNQPYFPRPDHKSENDQVSMSWAGVRSENLASVWLTDHLCEHLSRSQLEEVAGHLDLAPRIVDGEPEPYRSFSARLRDRYGILVTEDTIRQAAYRKVLRNSGPDLIFEGLEAEREAIMELHYGRGFDRFRRELERDPDVGGQKDELYVRRKILHKNFLTIATLREQLSSYVNQLLNPWSRSFIAETDISAKPEFFYDRATGSYLFDVRGYAPVEAVPVDSYKMQDYLSALSPGERTDFINKVKLADTISVAAFDFIKQQTEQEFQHLRQLLPYSMEVLEYVDDYRILVGLHYLIALGKTLGIESGLEPVLSFPLGSNVVTLLETTRVYEAIVTGWTTLFTEKNGEINNTLAIIDRIESEDGLVLYRPETERRNTISSKTTLAVGHILENVVKFGTGRYADRQVKLTSENSLTESFATSNLSVPLLGKTGTANRYTNASFIGFLPALNEAGNGMVIEGGYAVGVYVGYDDNKEMRRKATRITGAAGALPAWVDIVEAIIDENHYSAGLDPVDLTFYGLSIRRDDIGQKNLDVAEAQGGKLIVPVRPVDPLDRYHPSIITFGTIEDDKTFQPSRNFSPFWRNMGPVVSEHSGLRIDEKESEKRRTTAGFTEKDLRQ